MASRTPRSNPIPQNPPDPAPPLNEPPTNPPRLTPATFCEALTRIYPSASELCAYFHLSRATLEKLLESPLLKRELDLNSRVLALHSQLVGQRHIVNALNRLTQLVGSEKPEVARRAALSVTSLAGQNLQQPARRPSAASPKSEKSNSAFNTLKHHWREIFIEHNATMKDPTPFQPEQPFVPFKLDDVNDPRSPACPGHQAYIQEELRREAQYAADRARYRKESTQEFDRSDPLRQTPENDPFLDDDALPGVPCSNTINNELSHNPIAPPNHQPPHASTCPVAPPIHQPPRPSTCPVAPPNQQ